MPQRHRPPYAPEFRRQMIELVRAGRDPEQLAREFEPSAQAIRNWVAQADRDAGRRDDGLTTVEREELRRLRRECRPEGRGWPSDAAAAIPYRFLLPSVTTRPLGQLFLAGPGAEIAVSLRQRPIGYEDW